MNFNPMASFNPQLGGNFPYPNVPLTQGPFFQPHFEEIDEIGQSFYQELEQMTCEALHRKLSEEERERFSISLTSIFRNLTASELSDLQIFSQSSSISRSSTLFMASQAPPIPMSSPIPSYNDQSYFDNIGPSLISNSIQPETHNKRHRSQKEKPKKVSKHKKDKSQDKKRSAKTDKTPPQKTIEELRNDADNGDTKSMVEYGVKLREGKDVNQDLKESVRYFKMAADKGDADGLFHYGKALYEGKGISVNKLEAANIYLKAIAKGHSFAMNNYAYMLRKGEGVRMDKILAVKYYRDSIDKGFDKAMFGLAQMLEIGDGVSTDLPEAKRLYKMAADKGNVPSMFCLAKMIFGDLSSSESEKREAVNYIKTAAENGNEKAMIEYSRILSDGIYVKKNLSEAERYNKMAQKKIREKIKTDNQKKKTVRDWSKVSLWGNKF